jgi:hypothetical protein
MLLFNQNLNSNGDVALSKVFHKRLDNMELSKSINKTSDKSVILKKWNNIALF